MKVICDRPALLDAVNLVSGVVATRTPKPQLQCVKMMAAKGAGGVGSLTMVGTDQEVSIRLTTTQVDVQKPGEALIPADKLRQIVQAEDSEPTLTLETEGDVCHIRGGDARFKVYGYPAADFPPIPEFPASKAAMTMTAGDLQDLISKTIFAAARETSRYAINGVLLRRDGKRLEMVATDGRRLALARSSLTSADGAAKEPQSCIIPTKALNLGLKFIRDPEQAVRLSITPNQALFSFGDEGDATRCVLATNLVEGAFPPYEDVIPKEQDKKATFDRDVLASGVKRAALLTNEESRGVRLALENDRLRLSSRAPEMGEAEIDVPMTGYEGEPIEIGFNPQFITDALKVMSDQSVVVELKAPNKPGLIKSGADFLYVVMPVNLQ